LLVFDNKSTEAIKMNHLKTLICGGFVGADTDRLSEILRTKIGSKEYFRTWYWNKFTSSSNRKYT